MARNLCDFYVFKSPTQLAAKYVNAVLSQVEAQSTANALLKQYGAQFVCGINKGGASGPPRAPIKSGATGVPAVGSLPACWVYAGTPTQQQYKPGPKDYEVKFPARTSSGEMPHQGPLVPAMSTSFLRPSTAPRSGADQANPAYPRNPFGPNPGSPTSPVTSVRLAGAEGALGGVDWTVRCILVAYKGNKILKQWGMDRTASSSSLDVLGVEPQMWTDVAKDLIKKAWGSRPTGTTRICGTAISVIYVGGGGEHKVPPAWFCYNGGALWEGLTTPPPAAAQQINCPSGQVWDNTTKKCVPGQKGMIFDVKLFDAPAPLVSRGEQPHQGLLTTQTKLNTSFMRPQRVAGIEEQPMFRWIEKTEAPARDERAIEARLHGIGRDEDESGELGRTYSAGARQGPQVDYTNYPVQQKQPKLLTKPLKGYALEYPLYTYGEAGKVGYKVTLNKTQIILAPGDQSALFVGTTYKDGKLYLRVVVDNTVQKYNGPIGPGTQIEILAGTVKGVPEQYIWVVNPDGKSLTKIDYLKGYELSGSPQVGLGVVPWQVARWYSSNVKDWDQMSSEQQQSLLSAAKAKESAFQGYLQQFRNQGACDGTKPGLMAGALKEKLIAAGADKTKLDADDSVFGPGECAEWYRIFGANPTAADAAAAWQFGGNTFGGVQITYKDVCPSPKLPACPPPGGGSAPPGGGGGGVIDPCKDVTCMSGQKCVDGKCVPVPSETKKTNWGLVLLALAAGGGLIAAAAGAFPKAPKIPPREADLKANKRACANC